WLFGIALAASLVAVPTARADAFLDFSNHNQGLGRFVPPSVLDGSGSKDDDRPLPESHLDSYPVELYSTVLISEAGLQKLYRLVLRATRAF
ncbi:MAG TPA: hypothetical protein VM598_02800, partial [Bdellovibrionota bacterium]|nr:hypothetical protein [Bdellovibrionota bacterium]